MWAIFIVSWASEIKLLSMRRMGELLGPKAGAQGRRTDLILHEYKVKPPSLSELGVTAKISSLAQKIAAVPETIRPDT